ncbi:MAG: hypothetical protein JWO25_526 [Alphaproteobacteria bacterium]|nr:hypothetical protein [Alphaproteobacteria bacterium]
MSEQRDEFADEMMVVGRRRGLRPVLLALPSILLLALIGLWTQRTPIAQGYVDRELARRGVHGRYRIERIGLRTERVRDLVIGDSARPDLTARLVDIELAWSLAGPRVILVTARGVRMRGRIVGGKLDLGEVNRLLPAPGGGPFRLPDQVVDVADAGISLETPAGRLALGVEGKGKVSDGLRGRIALAARSLSSGSCRLANVHGNWTVAVDRLRPRLVGPTNLEQLDCGSIEAGRSRLELDALLEPALDGWAGSAGLRAESVNASGNRARLVSGMLSFAGNKVQTRGKLALSAQSIRTRASTASAFSTEGPYSVSQGSSRILFAGNSTLRRVQLDRELLTPVRRALAATASTPLGPIGSSLNAALEGAARSGLDVDFALDLASEGKGGAVRIARLHAHAQSGAQIDLVGRNGLSYFWPAGRMRVDTDLALSGGGLPDARISLSQARAGGPIGGRAAVAPMAAGGARLALGEVHFAQAGNGTRIETVATIDGPFNGGRVAGLVLPVRARLDSGGGFRLGEGCTSVSFRGLQAAGLRLGPAVLPLCPTGAALVSKVPGRSISGGASLAGLRLGGTLGSAPITIEAGRARFSLGDLGCAASQVAIRLGRAGGTSRLDVAALSGRADRGALAGSYSGLAGKLAAVPLLVSEGKGEWRLRGTSLAATGALTLADETSPPRFYPLVSRDFRFSLADNHIEAMAALGDPKTGTHIVDARISHDLASGAGRALLDVPGIKFDPAYQPDQLTRLTVGIVALVDGTLKGQGEIGWDSRGSRSTGTFSTENMNLAASFGPVEGLSTSIHFTDLLGLVAAPGQVATTKALRTGVDVFDGRLRYQLLPGLRIAVEEGRWPFAGGELRLEPTILDFSRPSPKQLTFRVAGMDGARFVQQMEFSNIAATGTFDGVVPMTFDERGGHIDGGHLVARESGGTLSYVGELSDKNLGAYGKLAFDALKSLHYSKLVVDLDGFLDGEFLAGIQLDGVARDVVAAPAPKGGISAMVVGRALDQLAKIPFKFRIKVRGPFRAVIGTTRSFEDPTNLIQSVLPQMLQNQPTSTTVQPSESEPVR